MPHIYLCNDRVVCVRESVTPPSPPPHRGAGAVAPPSYRGAGAVAPLVFGVPLEGVKVQVRVAAYQPFQLLCGRWGRGGDKQCERGKEGGHASSSLHITAVRPPCSSSHVCSREGLPLVGRPGCVERPLAPGRKTGKLPAPPLPRLGIVRGGCCATPSCPHTWALKRRVAGPSQRMRKPSAKALYCLVMLLLSM